MSEWDELKQIIQSCIRITSNSDSEATKERHAVYERVWQYITAIECARKCNTCDDRDIDATTNAVHTGLLRKQRLTGSLGFQ